jgi:hypothetical protein
MKIRSGTKRLFAALLAASFVTLSLTGTFLYLKHREGELGGCLIAFLAPFLLVGVGLALLALRELVGMMRYGTWELECPDGGGVAGEPLAVTIRPGRQIQPTGPVKLTVRCVEVISHPAPQGSRSGSQTQSTVVARVESQVVTGQLVDPRSGFAATLQPPVHPAPAVAAMFGGERVLHWQLVVEVPARDGDAHLTFELPIRDPG